LSPLEIRLHVLKVVGKGQAAYVLGGPNQPETRLREIAADVSGRGIRVMERLINPFAGNAVRRLRMEFWGAGKFKNRGGDRVDAIAPPPRPRQLHGHWERGG
jgi:hypothetical protein